MHQTHFSQKIPYGGFSQIRSHICNKTLIGGGSEDQASTTLIKLALVHTCRYTADLSTFAMEKLPGLKPQVAVN